MRFLLLALVLAAGSQGIQAQQPPKVQTPTKQAGPTTPASPAPQETNPPASVQAAPAARGDSGYMEPAQLKTLLHKIWLAAYRINDLLTEVHPEKWKTSDEARNSFNQTLENLRKALASQEEWRSQFEKRLDNTYFGYETSIAIAAVLPRLDAVARGVSQFENRSLGAQYSQAGNQLFDLQQSLQPYLEYLLRNQNQLLLAAQANLASCQNQLGFAMRNRMGPATPMKNVFTEYRVPRHSSGAASGRTGKPAHRPAKPAENKGGEKPKAKPPEATKAKPATPPAKPKT